MEKKPPLLGLPRKLALIGATTVAALGLLYTVGGFVLLPWYAQRELPRLLEQQQHRPAKIGAIRFNPSTRTVRLHRGSLFTILRAPCPSSLKIGNLFFLSSGV